MRSIATNLGILKSIQAELKGIEIIKEVKRKMKLVLTEANKVERVKFCETNVNQTDCTKRYLIGCIWTRNGSMFHRLYQVKSLGGYK